MVLLQDVVDERRLARAQEPGHDRHGYAVASHRAPATWAPAALVPPGSTPSADPKGLARFISAELRWEQGR